MANLPFLPTANQLKGIITIRSEARGRTVEGGSGERVCITLSLGIATQDSQNRFAKPQELLSAADEALYHSKRSGRDRHTCYDEIRAA